MSLLSDREFRRLANGCELSIHTERDRKVAEMVMESFAKVCPSRFIEIFVACDGFRQILIIYLVAVNQNHERLFLLQQAATYEMVEDTATFEAVVMRLLFKERSNG